MVYDNRYKVHENRTGENYFNDLQERIHEEMQTQTERLLEYGTLGSSNIPVTYAPNNKPDLGTGFSPSGH